jgi:transcription antitermination factor NusG
MKTSIFLTLLVAAFSLNVFAEIKYAFDEQDNENACDTIDSSRAADLHNCFVKHGRSKTYLAKQKELAKALREEQRKADKIAKLTSELTDGEFDFKGLQAAAFADRVFIAEKRVKSGYKLGEPEIITSGNNLCKFLGFEKAQVTKISDSPFEGEEGKVQVTKSMLRSKVDFELFPALSEDESENTYLYVFTYIKCVKRKDLKSKNEVFDAITEKVDYEPLVKTAVSLDEQTSNPDKNINDESRAGRKPAVVTELPESEIESKKNAAFINGSGVK